MTQSDSADVSTKLAEAHSARETNPEDASRTYSRVDKAAFNGAFEMLPDDAIGVVIDEAEKPPRVVALSGARLYVLTIGRLDNDLVGATSIVRSWVVDAKTSTVEAETQFVGHRRAEESMERQTTWRFCVADEEFSIETYTVPENDRLEKGEVFAQALASEIGWKWPEPSRSAPSIRVLG